MPMHSPVVDVDALLDGIRFRGLPLTVMLSAAAILALDGFDIQVIGFVAPALTAEFGVERSALAPVLAASLIGMALGGLCGGPVGDRWGRRPALFISTSLFGASTLLGSTATSLEMLMFWRLLAGVGFGGAMPNATALMAEFSPPKWRSQAIAAAIVGVPIGGIIGAAIASELIPWLGWRAVFVLGGVLPLLCLAVMYFVVPESPRYLAIRGNRARELAVVLNRIEGEQRYTGRETFVLGSSSGGKSAIGLRALFSRDLMQDTLAAWTIFGTNIFAVYAFFNWAPVVLTSLGFDLPTAVREALVFNLAGVFGALTLSWLIPRFGSRVPLALSAAVAAVSLIYLAWLSHAPAGTAPTVSLLRVTLGIATAGFAIIAIQIGMFAVVAHVYPTECRSTGVGWAIGLGRLGGILSSFAGGFFMANTGGESGFFVGVASILLLTFVGVLSVRRHIPAGASHVREARRMDQSAAGELK